MKKLLLIPIFLGFLLMSSCSYFIEQMTDDTQETQEQVTIDYERLESDVYDQVYERIYGELYYDIKDEILEDISQEEIQAIYQRVRDDILDKIDNEELVIEPVTVFDQVIHIGQTSAKSVIGVNNLDEESNVSSTGSGVIYKQDGNQYYVITNEHVVEDATTIEIQFRDESTVQAELLGVEKLVDLAVLKFYSEEELQVSSFGDSDSVSQGEFITAVGNPSGFDYFNTMTFGVVSGSERYFDIDDDGTRDMFVAYIQHDAAINSGNSGGALFNMQGEIIGINTLKLVDFSIEGMGFAIPANLVELIANDIELYGYSRRKPMLGITFVDISQNKEALNAEEQLVPEEINQGFFVQAVVEGSSVDGYVLPGDIILEIGGFTIENTNQFVEEFSQFLVGDVIDIVVYRNGDTITLTDIELKGRE